MNRWLVTATPNFRTFISEICAISTLPESRTPIDPQLATPLQIMARLPEISNEGSLTLPYLLDSAKLYSDLVKLWIENAPQDIEDRGISQALKEFHYLAGDLYGKTQICKLAAQNVDKPGRSYEQQWEELMLERQAGAGLMNPFEDNFIILEEQRVGSTPRQNRPSGSIGGRGTYAGPTSGSGPGFPRQAPIEHDLTTISTNSTNSSTVSFDTTNLVARKPSQQRRDVSGKNTTPKSLQRSGSRK